MTQADREMIVKGALDLTRSTYAVGDLKQEEFEEVAELLLKEESNLLERFCAASKEVGAPDGKPIDTSSLATMTEHPQQMAMSLKLWATFVLPQFMTKIALVRD